MIHKTCVVLLILLLTKSALANEHQLPKLELGASLAVLDIPNYRGSANSTTRVFPLPYFRYRGDRLKIDDGIQNTWFSSPDWRLSLSANGTLPVDDDNPERVGMDELDATIEIGPSLDYRIAHRESSEWWIEMPLRFGFTLNSDFEQIGQIFQPRLVWRKTARHVEQWKLRAAIGPIYASSEFHDYYYSVHANEALPDRAEFDADSGYSGYRSTFSYSRRYGKLTLGGFVRYDSLKQSVVEDSPLISENSAWMAGFAIGWVFLER